MPPYNPIKPTCHPDRKHHAKGLCQNCYHKSPNPRKYREGYAAEKSRRDRLKHFYGLTEDDYNAMNTKQQGLCAICGQPPRGNMKNLSVDHDHVTGKVRGLLCITCNRAVGYLENTEWRQKAEEYLRAPDETPKFSFTNDTPEGFCPCGGKMLDAGPPIGTYCERGWNCTNHY